ncbi:MAG TPA: two-component regulator propeller domain-containing protein [Blastocatellia bacterium]|nr:two-component regulator propeller domain-containing protein [Blastocatellia bacterium]
MMQQSVLYYNGLLLWLRPTRLLSAGLCGLILVCVGAAEAIAQYRFDYWTTDNGLPQNGVNSITQTPDGYLWFATSDGLVRYDGVRFTVFDQGNSKGLRSNRFLSLYADEAGTLWAGTEDGGLVRYRDGAFTSFTTADGLPDNYVRSVQSDGAGGLGMRTNKGWVSYHDGAFSLYSPVNPFFFEFYFSPSGTRWTWDLAGLRQARDGREITYPIPLSRGTSAHRTLYEDRSGALWAASTARGVFRVKDGTVTHYAAKEGLDAEVTTIFEDRLGSVWLGTIEDGLVRLRDGRFTAYTTADGLSSNWVESIFEDREGTLWIGTWNRGLNRVTRQFITSLSMRDGLAGENIYPILEDRTGNIWLGTESGLTRYANGTVTNYKVNYPRAGPVVYIQTIAEDRDGGLWLSDYTNTIYFKDGKSTFPPEIAGKIGQASAIYQDSQANVWFGTLSGLFKLRDGAVTSYTTADGLPSNDIKLIYEDRRGGLWFATYGGLAKLEAPGSSSPPAFTTYTTEDSLGSNRVRSFYEDAEGIFWIGTYDGGLSRLKDGRITTYTTSQGLFNNGAFQILEDSRGNFWISSNRGIYRVSRGQLNDFAEGRASAITCVAYGRLDGMLNTECNGGRQPAGVRARDGKLWFPTQGGAVIIDPEAVPFNQQPPPVLIEAVTIDRAPVAFGEGIRLGPGQQNLEINYTGLSYIKPDQVRFKYKLVGQDTDWIEAGTRRAAYYPYLPPGDYTFTVVAANSDGVWNPEGTSLRITILPPFYSTWWFSALAVTAVTGLALLFYRRRVSQLRREKAAQEIFSRRLIASQEGERKRISAELHDSLGQSLVVIKNLAVMLLYPSDEETMRQQAHEISAETSRAIGEVKEISYNLRPFHLDQIGLTRSIESLIDNVAKACDIKFSADLDHVDGLISADEGINLYRIAQEGLNNVVKHSGATEASVTLRLGEQDLTLTIKDNGRGLERPAQDTLAQKSGFGLTGINERARLLGGEAHILGEPGHGTTVRVKIDLKGRTDGR